jgi:hypothetical protein
MNVAATAEQRKKIKSDKEAEKKRMRGDKKTLLELQRLDQKKGHASQIKGGRQTSIWNPSIGGNNPMPRTFTAANVIIGDSSTNPISAADNQLRTRTASSQKV